MINGERIKQVRELRGFTQTEFARSIGVHQSEIAQIETGRITPGDEIVQQIAFKTGFPISFFKQPTSVDFPLGSLLYRARASITLKERNRANQFARTVYEVIDRFQNDGNIINEISVRVPSIDDLPNNAAITTRSALGLSSNKPIDDLINALELGGCIIIALPTQIEKIDAFSLWVGQQQRKPVIVLANRAVSGDRLRFSIAHELGHLVIHQRMIGGTKKMDEEANVFAGEFLLPKEAMLQELTPPVTILSLMQLKSKWKVSMQAIVNRAFRLQIINDVQYRYLMYQISSRYGRKTEPVEIPTEKPRLLGQLAETLYGSPIDYKKLASHMNLPIQLVRETIESHCIRVKSTDNQSNGAVIKFPMN